MMGVWLLFFGVAGGSAAIGWLAGRRARRQGTSAKPPASAQLPAGWPFPFRPGDALSRAPHEELLVERAEVLCDGGEPAVAVLTGLAERGANRLCVCFLPPREDVLWLGVLPREMEGEPPTSLEHEGHRFERTRSIPVTVGDASEPGTFAEYRRSSGERMIVLRTAGRTLVAHGESVPIAGIERFPGS